MESRPLEPAGAGGVATSKPCGDLKRRQPITLFASLLQPLELREIVDRAEKTLKQSPADETELVWLEVQRGVACQPSGRLEFRTTLDRSILVRVVDRGRVGSHRTGSCDPGDLDNAVRLAVAQSRAREALPGLLHLPTDDTPLPSIERLRDRAVSQLDAKQVESMFSRWQARRARLSLGWADARVGVVNSRGLRRTTHVTCVTLEASFGTGPGAGRAIGSSRTLKDLRPRRIVDQARQRHASGVVSKAPSGPVPLALSGEATSQLCDILNRVAFSAIAYYRGSSFLREHMGVQVFDRKISLVDSATDPAGLPFPFDLEGTAKTRVHLIDRGTPKTPALDHRQAAQLGLTPTAHAVGGNDARALNLFLLPGELSESEFLAAAEGGLWIGWLEQLECFEPSRVQIRAHARGVRRIRNGKLAEAVPDLVWEDSLLRAFSNIQGIGRRPALLAGHDGYLGGISAPPLALASVSDLRPI